MLFRMVYKSGHIFLSYCHNPHVRQTDRQTDGRTDRQNSHRYRPLFHAARDRSL